jgi:hypothetical protein
MNANRLGNAMWVLKKDLRVEVLELKRGMAYKENSVANWLIADRKQHLWEYCDKGGATESPA